MNLYRIRTFRASLIVLLVCAGGFTALAQRRKPHKLRSTALVELTTDATGVMTTRVIPITILDEGSFHDASSYKATPRPMALDTGVVYEAQKSGQSMGYATITNAGKTGGWGGRGKWDPVGALAKPPPAPTAPAAPGDDRPILHHGDSNTASAKASSVPSPTPTPSSDAVQIAPAEDPDRPLLRHRKPDADSQSASRAKPVSSPAPEGVAPSRKLPGPKAGTQTMVAVSHAESRDGPPFQSVSKPGHQ